MTKHAEEPTLTQAPTLTELQTAHKCASHMLNTLSDKADGFEHACIELESEIDARTEAAALGKAANQPTTLQPKYAVRGTISPPTYVPDMPVNADDDKLMLILESIMSIYGEKRVDALLPAARERLAKRGSQYEQVSVME